ARPAAPRTPRRRVGRRGRGGGGRSLGLSQRRLYRVSPSAPVSCCPLLIRSVTGPASGLLIPMACARRGAVGGVPGGARSRWCQQGGGGSRRSPRAACRAFSSPLTLLV